MKVRLASLKGLIGIVAVFLLVMGGLMGGVFTPQEAGAVGTVAMIVVSLFYRQLTWKKLGERPRGIDQDVRHDPAAHHGGEVLQLLHHHDGTAADALRR